MTEDERFEMLEAIRLLDSWLHCGKVEKPRMALLEAMNKAVHAMQRLREYKMYERTCAVLSYHIAHPLAELFRDPVTIGAIKTGISVMERALKRE